MIFLLLIAIQIVGGHGRYHYVLAPNVIRFENEETLVVGVLGDVRRQQISVWLEYLDMAFSKSTVIVPDAEHPLEVSIKVTEHDLFSDKPSSVRLICDGPYGKQTRDIILSYESGYVIVQTDKPLYNPREPVYVRVLAMDEAMNPIKHNRLEIDLINPLNRTVDRVTLKPGKKNGIYRWKFEFPSVVDFGTWTIIARIGGMFETWGVFSIEVREFVLPTFGVTITPSRTYILPSDDTILVVVTSE
ncbi:hypothetical protein DPMN_022705 [Dreissena polymorpha]|uniref:Macroglobulin domain-containing protein n=1 Tax=Dreissena polymorpha TaxID=45954 RepID=A0A9D4SCJ8_DREPO|nr:hypothetical protein DPMN_022705 [Dreissena polymorpha]